MVFGFRFFVLDQIKSSTPTLNGLKVEGTVSPRMCAFLYFVFYVDRVWYDVYDFMPKGF